jgi:hypothetical protein
MELPKSSEINAVLPGDSIEFWFELHTDSQTLINLATHEVNKAVYADPRFDMQGIRNVEATDYETGQPASFVVVTVTARKTPRHQPEQEYEAGVGAVIAIAGLVAAVAACIVAYEAIELRSTNVIASVANNPNLSAAEKLEALNVMQKSTIGGGLAAAGGSLLTAAIIVAVIWVMTRSRTHRGDY